MPKPVIAIYAGDPIGPGAPQSNFDQCREAGWNTVILSLFHIGRPDVTGQQYGDIVFNGGPIVIQAGTWQLPDDNWPESVATLKQGGSVSSIYASIGGGDTVEDFGTLQKIYEDNGNSFAGTPLEANFTLFRQRFPAVDGIDLDCEDVYDPPSFVAFCVMLAGLGFAITFCPYTSQSFWTGCLQEVDAATADRVKWWNLQLYSGGYGNDPDQWATDIRDAIPSFDTTGYIVAGYDAIGADGVRTSLGAIAQEASVGGCFIWNLDEIGDQQAAYVEAIKQTLNPY